MASVTTSPLGLLLFPLLLLLLLQLAAADRLLSQQLTSPADSCGRIHPACLACGTSNGKPACTSCSPVRYVVANGTCGEWAAADRLAGLCKLERCSSGRRS